MDPDEALKQMRNALDAIHGVGAATRGSAGWHDAVKALAEAAIALDTWMANGGFIPDAWMIHRTEARVSASLRKRLREVSA